MRFSSCSPGLVLLIAGLTAACGERSPTDVERATSVRAVSSGPVLVECPTDVTTTVTKTLGTFGGSIEVGGHRVDLPLGAVRRPTQFTVTIPASRFVEVHITADGQHGFRFYETAAITISYERCTRSNITDEPLAAWKIDPATQALLKPMGGSVDHDTRRVTFSTDSLSAYAIAQ
ncbi:MAG TPA: hypothetical protein VFZ24_05760 [Longimicrobiales bacterium]